MDTDAKSGNAVEVRPRPLMLKDFLRDDSNSSNDFRSYPRRSCATTIRNLVELDLTASETLTSPKLQRSRSRAASATITTLQRASEAVIKAVKYLPFSPGRSQPSDVRKQGILPRSFSQRLRRSFRSKSRKCDDQVMTTVRVRDIMRWKSFNDVEREAKPVDFPSSSIQTSSTNSSRSSWTESDFSSDFSHSSSSSSEFSGENEAIGVKKCLLKKQSAVGEDSVETATCCRKPKIPAESPTHENTYEEKEQLSPVSILDFPDDDEDTASSSFKRSLANMERTKQQLLRKIRHFERLADLSPIDLDKRIFDIDCSSGEDEKNTKRAQENDEATELLKLAKSNLDNCSETKVDRLLLDFFRQGLRDGGSQSKEVLLRTARDWLSGCDRGMRWEVEENREAHVREMEAGGRWRKFAEEEEDIALVMEIGVLGSMLDELLLELLP